MSEASDQNAPAGHVTISEAIRLAGVSRSTFYQYLNGGKISASLVNFKGKDKKFVQVSELLRVFGAIQGEQPKTNTPEPSRTASDSAELARLRAENAGLRELVEEIKASRDNALQDKATMADLLAESVKTVRLLENRQAEQSKENTKKQGFFSRLFARKE